MGCGGGGGLENRRSRPTTADGDQHQHHKARRPRRHHRRRHRLSHRPRVLASSRPAPPNPTQLTHHQVLTKLAGITVDDEKRGLLASTGIFRCIIIGKYLSGPAYVYGFEFVAFFVLGL